MKKENVIALLVQNFEKKMRELSYNELLEAELYAYKLELKTYDSEQLELQALVELDLDIDIKE